MYLCTLFDIVTSSSQIIHICTRIMYFADPLKIIPTGGSLHWRPKGATSDYGDVVVDDTL